MEENESHLDDLTQNERFTIVAKRYGGLSVIVMKVLEKTGEKMTIGGLSNYQRGQNKGIGSDKIALLLRTYPDFPIHWWLTGEGRLE